ncbi:MAG TPA: hypothetical protein VFS43_00345 [Polyangiaceae bacterium]|nr:hypothetical protein [Polyangiaceae bacterium]
MKFQALALLPAAWVGAFVAGAAAVPPAIAPTFIRTEIEAAKVMTLVGCVAAARAFSPGDYLRRAWVVLGGCWVLLLARDALFLGLPRGALVAGVPIENVMAALATGANVLGVVSTFMIAKAWHVAGLELPGKPAQRAVAMALWVALSVAITGRAALNDGRLLFAGEVPALVGLSSAVCDLLSMCLVAPVLFTALALRGGRLRWPWAFMTASLLFWLFYDAGHVLAQALGLSEFAERVLRESFRGLACLYSFSAGVAQALALREPVSPRPPRAA